MVIRAATTGAAVWLLGGCLAGSSPLAADLEVRDARTGAPIAGAAVRTTGLSVLQPPISPWADPPAGRFESGADGAVAIVLAGNRPNELTVTAQGYAPLHLTLQAGSVSVAGATDWSTGRLPPINGSVSPPPRLEVRVRAKPPAEVSAP
jgi:hypothetical protein